MMIVLIHWRIKPDRVDEFLAFWKQTATVADRSELVTEMLSEVRSPKDFWYATWSLDPESFGNFKSFVNVGIWNDDQAFKEQIADKFNDDLPLKSFEMYRRRRAILTPKTWRIGNAQLPNDLPDVL
jgi:hypothetical protein